MERLTKREDEGIHLVYQTNFGRKDNAIDARCKAIGRLAAYEDTGLEPEEINQFTRLEKMIGADRLRELLAADKDGRCAVLPCKVGQTVYLANKIEKRICICLCAEIRQAECGWFAVGIDRETGFKFSLFFDLFGKTVFLTRDSAEAALKAGDNR